MATKAVKVAWRWAFMKKLTLQEVQIVRGGVAQFIIQTAGGDPYLLGVYTGKNLNLISEHMPEQTVDTVAAAWIKAFS